MKLYFIFLKQKKIIYSILFNLAIIEKCYQLTLLMSQERDDSNRMMIETIQLNLTVNIANQLTRSDVKKFNLIYIDSICFIETDKAVYKPNDLVRIRILTLDYDLKLLKNVVYDEISIQDSTNAKYYLARNVLANETTNGFVEIEFQLSNEANLGNWSVLVERRRKSRGGIGEGEGVNNKKTIKKWKKFELRKYVVEEFDLKYFMKIAINENMKTFHIQLCAK